MLLLAFSDVHGSTVNIEKLANYLQKNSINVDAIAVCGDITHYGSYKDAEQIISELEKINRNIFAVAGNADTAAVAEFLDEKGYSINLKCKSLSFCKIAGINGSVGNVGEIIFSEAEYKEKLSKLSCNGLNLFISHCPPKKILDLTSHNEHLGSFAIKEFIANAKPKLHLFGHVHEQGGNYIRKGKTIYVNVASLRDGRFIIIELNSNCLPTAIEFIDLSDNNE